MQWYFMSRKQAIRGHSSIPLHTRCFYCHSNQTVFYTLMTSRAVWEAKPFLQKALTSLWKKNPKNRGSANQRDFGLRTKWFQWKLSIISQQKQKIFHQHAWKTHLKFSVSVGRQVTCFKTIFNQSLLSLTSCCQTSGSRDYLTPEEPRVQKGTFPNNPLLSSHTLYLPLKRRGQKGRLCEGYKPSL